MRKDSTPERKTRDIRVWDTLIATARARMRRDRRHAAHLRALVRVFELKRSETPAVEHEQMRPAMSRRLRSA
jgi:hypothetical protein